MTIVITNIHLADTVKFIHYIMILFINGAWSLPFNNCWNYNIVLVPFIFIQWYVTNMECVLTKLEYELRHGKPYNIDEHNGFVDRIIIKYLGDTNTKKYNFVIHSFMYSLPILSWVMCINNKLMN
jgi:hypothetical protein